VEEGWRVVVRQRAAAATGRLQARAAADGGTCGVRLRCAGAGATVSLWKPGTLEGRRTVAVSPSPSGGGVGVLAKWPPAPGRDGRQGWVRG
jgi:hypothetical protein